MRKIAPIALLALFAVATTSCKKQWTCKCTTTTTINGQTTTASASAKSEDKMSKKDAKEKCNKGDMEFTNNGASYVVDCEIE